MKLNSIRGMVRIPALAALASITSVALIFDASGSSPELLSRFAAVAPLGAQPANDLPERIQDGYVAWKPIAGARGYKVQVRSVDNPDKILSDTTVQKTYMKVDLAVGRYEIRTTPLNDFGRVTVWSAWQPLRIIISRRPELDPESDQALSVNNLTQKQFRFSVTGNHFFKDVTQVVVRDPVSKQKIPVRELDIAEDGRRLVIQLDVAQASQGSYSLELINPFGKTLVRQGFLDVSSRREMGNMALTEYDAYVQDLTRGCRSATKLPDLLIKRCEEHFIVLNLSDRDRTNLYYYLHMTGENYYDRLGAYDFFARNCPPVFAPGEEYMRKRLKSLDEGVDTLEKAHIRRALTAIDSCR